MLVPTAIIILLCGIRVEEDHLAAWLVAARLAVHLTSFAPDEDLIDSLIFVRSHLSVDGTGVLRHSTGAALLNSLSRSRALFDLAPVTADSETKYQLKISQQSTN
jgi:hypothetical protein